jgi:hypothetical protein
VREALELGLVPWRGEDITGKRLLVMHAHGFGDTIMMLRYVPQLKAMGADVVLMMPRELAPLAQQFAPVTSTFEACDYFCPILLLLHFLKVTWQSVDGSPYIPLPQKRSGIRKIGIAWSVGKPSIGDYPRVMDIETLLRGLPDAAEIHSVQTQDKENAERLGVRTHNFANFLECAELMMRMDEIISVDTAALHLAGAIGHPRVYAMLSHWASWRWVAPWYNNMTQCRQASPGDWQSALVQTCLLRELQPPTSA